MGSMFPARVITDYSYHTRMVFYEMFYFPGATRPPIPLNCRLRFPALRHVNWSNVAIDFAGYETRRMKMAGEAVPRKYRHNGDQDILSLRHSIQPPAGRDVSAKKSGKKGVKVNKSPTRVFRRSAVLGLQYKLCGNKSGSNNEFFDPIPTIHRVKLKAVKD